jgi:hypothetical protein
MRKLLIAIAFLAFGSAHAASYGVAGCGLGSLVFKNEKGPVQILAATTNGTFGSQTFGITTGTSNCNDGANLIKAYIETNHDAIKTAAARGQGEVLVGLANVYHCNNAEALSSALRTNYKNVFNSDSAVKTQSGIESVIRMTPELNATCGNLS